MENLKFYKGCPCVEQNVGGSVLEKQKEGVGEDHLFHFHPILISDRLREFSLQHTFLCECHCCKGKQSPDRLLLPALQKIQMCFLLAQPPVRDDKHSSLTLFKLTVFYGIYLFQVNLIIHV